MPNSSSGRDGDPPGTRRRTPDTADTPATADAPGAPNTAAASTTANTPSAPDTSATPAALEHRLVALARALRQHGIGVGTSDVIDAGLAAAATGFDNRERLRAGLAATLMRREEQRRVFDDLFDLYFPVAVGARTQQPTELDEPAAAIPQEPAASTAPQVATQRHRAQELTEQLARALAAADERALAALAATVVVEFGELRRPGEQGFSANQAIEQFQPNLAIARAAELMANGPESGGEQGGTGGGSGGRSHTSSGGAQTAGAGGWQPETEMFSRRFDRDDARERVAVFRRRIESEARRRNAELRGVERQSRYAVSTPLERRPFAQTYSVDAAEMRRVVEPLARKLAARMTAKRRRASHGRIDVRKTLRSAIATGGVPIKPVFTRHAPNRAELVLLADMSSSVAGFSRFTILLMQAMHGQFARLRVFGFINTVDELTSTVHEVGPHGDLIEALRGNRRMTRGHTNSDYGTTFVDFLAQHSDALTPHATVLILGDARTNNTDPRYEALREIAAQAKRVIWLNPEAESQWGQGDSVAHRYAAIVDMHESRTITDLRDFVARTL